MSARDTRPTWRRTARRTSVALLATLGLLEAGARLLESLPDRFGPGDDHELADAGAYRVSPDPVLRWELAPGTTLTTRLGVTISINDAGFRGPRVDPGPAPPGRVRIAVLGDSETFGEKLPAEDTLPGALRRALEERWGSEVEVLNFGTNGYDTRQETRLFERRVVDYAPDAVLLYYVTNDPLPIELMRSGPLVAHSALARLARGVWVLSRLRARMDDAGSYAEWVRRSFAPGSPAWAANRALVLGLVRAIEEAGARAVVVIAPELYDLESADQLEPERNPYRPFNEALRGLERDGVTVVDPQAALVGSVASPRELWVTDEDHHKNALANRLIAAHVAASGALDGLRERRAAGPGEATGGMVRDPPRASRKTQPAHP